MQKEKELLQERKLKKEEIIEAKRMAQRMKQKTRREIVFVTVTFVCIFVCMMGYTCYYAMTHKQEMINNAYNPQQDLLIQQNYRGSILSADGEILAQTSLDSDGNEKRVYPYNNVFSHVVGFSTYGTFGVEALSNYYLIQSNTDLSDKVQSDIAGLKYPGDNVITTLDVALQEEAYQALSIYKGAIIATEPKTGKILAMVSKPDFDPNTIESMWEDISKDKDSSILLNRVTQGLYPPGSTFKILTALEYIRENPDTYNNYSYNCTGRYAHGDDVIRCYHGTVHGNQSLLNSFANSCNASFTNIGMSLDRDAFRKTLTQAMFNEELPVSFIYNRSNVAVSSDIADADMMQVSIGQGSDSITPLHLNMITAAIANGGEVMKPYVVDRVETAKGDIVKQFSPTSYREIMSEEEAKALTELMTAVVEKGTGKRLGGLQYTAAGKTGSAEFTGNTDDSHAWFTGFAPVDDPQICVTVIIECAGTGGDYAVPMARRMFDACLVYGK